MDPPARDAPSPAPRGPAEGSSTALPLCPPQEPFVELLKCSLNTFLNALTYTDKTCYPVASCNLQDFYILVDVYLDAVFYPTLTEDTLRQEGWHLELQGPDAPLTYKGVVFNEMKGVCVCVLGGVGGCWSVGSVVGGGGCRWHRQTEAGAPDTTVGGLVPEARRGCRLMG